MTVTSFVHDGFGRTVVRIVPPNAGGEDRGYIALQPGRVSYRGIAHARAVRRGFGSSPEELADTVWVPHRLFPGPPICALSPGRMAVVKMSVTSVRAPRESAEVAGSNLASRKAVA